MGVPRPTERPASYRDDPDALSLHTTPSVYADTADHPDSEFPASTSSLASALPPPSYDDSTVDTSSSDELGSANHDPAGRFSSAGITSAVCHQERTSKAIWQKRARIACERVDVQDKRADVDPALLQSWIEYMAKHAPSPYIHVTGTHNETKRDSSGKGNKTESVTDFRLLISMRNYLWPGFREYSVNDMELRTVDNGEKTFRGTILKKRAPGAKGDIEVGEPKPELKEWCHRFCASSSGNKVMRLSRSVTGFDEQHMKSRLEGLIRSTNYKGCLTIEFPVADRAVDIYTSTRLNNWRLITWVRWLFYLTFFWIFSWPVLYFTTKRYHIVRAEWPFSQIDAGGHKRYTTVSEEQWINKFGPAVRQLCLDRYQGLAGDAFLTQVLSRPETHQSSNSFGGGQAVVNAAIGAFQGELNSVSQVNNLLRYASSDQVGWGFDT